MGDPATGLAQPDSILFCCGYTDPAIDSKQLAICSLSSVGCLMDQRKYERSCPFAEPE